MVLFFTIRTSVTVVKACKRFNKLYNYFIVNQNNPFKGLNNSKLERSDRPDPNDGSGCPKEEELSDAD